MSRLFSFTLGLISDRVQVQPNEVIGHLIGWGIKLADAETDRFFNGHVIRFTDGAQISGKRKFQAEVVPWLWFLTQTTDCRVFQDLTVPQILEKIFEKYPVAKFEISELKRTYPPREYCVQYRESDFNFVSRLMEEEGIFYYFKFTKNDHTLVLADQVGGYKSIPENDVELEEGGGSIGRVDRVTSWQSDASFITHSWTQSDYNFITDSARNRKTPEKILETQVNSKHILNNPRMCHLFDAPGDYADSEAGQVYTKIRMEEQEAAFEVFSGTSLCKTFTVGGKFKITRHVFGKNGSISTNHAITVVRHEAHEPASFETGETARLDYQNSFRCIHDTVIFRPERITPKPLIHGSQTAVVTGPPGEEIWPDKFGRVKVQFFWDRIGERTEDTSCWIRCTQSIAGKSWGAMVIPRIGQEVVVSYLEGNPDRPLITGGVYNEEQMPAYTLPDEKTKTVFKSNSSPGGEGFNELRIEDKKGKEQIFVHAERNMDLRVKSNSMERVGGSRHLIVGSEQDKAGDHQELIYGEKHLNIKQNQSEKIEGNYDLTIGLGEGPGGNFDVYTDKRKTEEVGEDFNFIVGGVRNESVTGKYSLTCSDHHQKVKQTVAVDAGQEIHLKSGVSVIIEATNITLASGGNFITIGPSGVSITGTMVMINSGGVAEVGSGATPEQPFNANQAAPKQPAHADNAKTGKKSAPDSLV